VRRARVPVRARVVERVRECVAVCEVARIKKARCDGVWDLPRIRPADRRAGRNRDLVGVVTEVVDRDVCRSTRARRRDRFFVTRGATGEGRSTDDCDDERRERQPNDVTPSHSPPPCRRG
jgi:hypothetical protein